MDFSLKSSLNVGGKSRLLLVVNMAANLMKQFFGS